MICRLLAGFEVAKLQWDVLERERELKALLHMMYLEYQDAMSPPSKDM